MVDTTLATPLVYHAETTAQDVPKTPQDITAQCALRDLLLIPIMIVFK